MGLATAQARFLGITARKADCEYKSTEIAQQKLEITNQLSQVSADYSNALNSTKLVWQNDATNKITNVTYSMLMSPSALNDYNPYLITTPSGAIVLNSEYAAAAKAAGISKAGGFGSQDSRDKFIASLVKGGIVTQETAAKITKTDYYVNDSGEIKEIPASNVDKSGPVANTKYIDWNASAGMGAKPKDKGNTDIMDLSGLILSESIGQQKIDWTSMFVDSSKGEISETEYDKNIKELNDTLKKVQKADISNSEKTDINSQTDYNNQIEQLDKDIAAAKAAGNENTYNEKVREKETLIKNNPIKAAKYDLDAFKNKYSDTSKIIKFDTISSKFQTDKSEVKDSTIVPKYSGSNSNNVTSYEVSDGITVIKNGSINRYGSEIKDLTIGDLLSGNITIMIQNSNAEQSASAMSNLAKGILDSITKVLGYGQSTGTGLNVDDASAKALEYAYKMVVNTYLKPGNAIKNGGKRSDTSMTDNNAYINATTYNRIGQNDNNTNTGSLSDMLSSVKKNTYTAISLSNMLSSFLTFYDNSLSGSDSNYVVGKSVETSAFVTDDSSYVYIGKSSGTTISQEEKLADFFDEIYNNICEHGWREDSTIDDEEYLGSAIKDGRYSMSSLNNDGYYYQTRYNETGYIEEVTDDDAIARAEAEYQRMKSELTYKEDSMDLKSKKLDAEISTLSTEYETVQKLISKNIEKTFTMFN